MKKFIEKAKNVAGQVAPLLLLFPAVVFAQETPPITPPTILQNGIGGVGTTLYLIFQWMFYFLVVLTVIFVVYAAFKYLFAAGDPAKVQAAGHMLIYACVAMAVGLIAKAVPGIVSTLLGGGNITTGY